MRFLAAIEPLASTRKRIRFPSRACPRLRRFPVPLAARRLVAPLALASRRSAAVRAVGRFGLGILREGVLQFFGIYAGLLERTTPAAVREGEQGGVVDVFEDHLVASVPGGEGTGGLRGHQVA